MTVDSVNEAHAQQTLANAAAMVEPIRDLFNANAMPNSEALLALAVTFQSILASTRPAGPAATAEVTEVIHETLRNLCGAASVEIVLEALASFTVDTTLAINLNLAQEGPSAQ